MHLDLLFHCCTGKGAKTKLHQEYPHRKKRIPPLSRKLVFFANRNTQKNMQLLDKIQTVFTAALICASLSQTHYWHEVGMLKAPCRGTKQNSLLAIRCSSVCLYSSGLTRGSWVFFTALCLLSAEQRCFGCSGLS